MLMQLLIRLIPPAMIIDMPYLKGLGLNLHILAFACAIALVAAVLFSAVPMLGQSVRTPQADLS